jgi:hypothetical protein
VLDAGLSQVEQDSVASGPSCGHRAENPAASFRDRPVALAAESRLKVVQAVASVDEVGVAIDEPWRHEVAIKVERHRLLSTHFGETRGGASVLDSTAAAEHRRIGDKPERSLAELWVTGDQNPNVPKKERLGRPSH